MCLCWEHDVTYIFRSWLGSWEFDSQRKYVRYVPILRLTPDQPRIATSAAPPTGSDVTREGNERNRTGVGVGRQSGLEVLEQRGQPEARRETKHYLFYFEFVFNLDSIWTHSVRFNTGYFNLTKKKKIRFNFTLKIFRCFYFSVEKLSDKQVKEKPHQKRKPPKTTSWLTTCCATEEEETKKDVILLQSCQQLLQTGPSTQNFVYRPLLLGQTRPGDRQLCGGFPVSFTLHSVRHSGGKKEADRCV